MTSVQRALTYVRGRWLHPFYRSLNRFDRVEALRSVHFLFRYFEISGIFSVWALASEQILNFLY